MLTGIIQYKCKINKEVKAIQNEIKKNRVRNRGTQGKMTRTKYISIITVRGTKIEA